MNSELQKIKSLVYTRDEDNMQLAKQLCISQRLSYIQACSGYYVPETIKMYVSTQPTWDGKYNTFPANPNSEKICASAAQWAKTENFDEIKNHFHQFEILDYASERRGVPTYKASIDGKYIVDLRWKALLEIMQTSQLSEKKFFGDFCFVQRGSQITFVEMFSELFEEALVAQISREDREAQKVRKKTQRR